MSLRGAHDDGYVGATRQSGDGIASTSECLAKTRK